MFRFIQSSQFLLACCTLAVAGEASYPPLEALRLVDQALKKNPALASAHLSASAAHSEGEQSRAWEEPEVGFDAFQTPIGSFPNPFQKGQEYDYSVSQVIPFPGKLEAMAKPHHLHGAVEERRAEAMELQTRRDVLSAYADLYSAEWRLKLIREEKNSIERLFGTTRVVYEGGGSSQTDLLRIESEMAELDAGALEAEQLKVEAHASISSLLGSGNAEVNPVDSMTPGRLEMNPTALRRIAMERRPDLEAVRQEMAMADAEVVSKSKEAYPDFALRGMYKDMRTEAGARGFWSVGVGMKVPIAPWSSKGIRAGVEQARVQHRKSEQDFAAAQQSIDAEVERAAASLRTASGRVEVMEKRSVPLADQIFRSTLSAYQVGKADLNEALMAFRETRIVREEYHLAVANHLKAWATLEWVTGGTLQ